MSAVDPETAVYNLMQRDPNIIAVAILNSSNNIIYTTDNWDVSGDIGKVMSSWASLNAQFIMISGVKYSMLAQTMEGFTATSIRGEGHIIGAKDDEHRVIAYLEPDGYMQGASMDVQKCLADMSNKKKAVSEDISTRSNASAAMAGGGNNYGASIDPQLKGEIQAFLDWVKDSEGLAGYIKYYIDQNNGQIMAAMAQVYNELRQIFGV
ncbi:MAG: hypothetical protein JW891_01160 [Candidatus Lokiarchaeota archaeon]|nr:hypothetical protein [Candidatus Lokiarchaeota archaeon]